ncbi:MAG: coproporphyrinogen dehydrogenase HemZ [Bacillota bacterium]|nr:coproporphyrinogen dehydrogenase HemZ [Bacillota bacterium]MDW7683880.1 coproporphyrinogen dehydrogenase HemZ [Bacillota bacterium]
MGKPWGKMVGIRPTKELHRLLDAGMNYEEAFARMHAEYNLGAEKFDLLWRVARVERPVLMECSSPDLFSAYVGIPFCPTRCLYCSFPSHSLHELGELRQQFVDTLISETIQTGELCRSLGLKPYSVYVGGGTPTALDPGDLDRILGALRTAFPGVLREFTVEAGRPDTLTGEHLAVMKEHRVDRVSVNPQTRHDKTLELIGRCHSFADVEQAVNRVKGFGFTVLNTDIIIGLPGEDTDMVQQTAQAVLSLAPENITVHMFSRKRASRYNEEQNRFVLPADHTAAAMYQAVTGLLQEKYNPYYLYRQRDILGGQENIGYCLPGHACAYNIAMIEERHHIIGLGCGATSKLIRPDFTLTNLHSPKDPRIYPQRLNQLLATRKDQLTKLLK